MVDEIAGQAGAGPPAMFFHQLGAAFARRKIQRVLVAQVTGDAEAPDQRLETGNGIAARAIGA